MKLEEVSLTGRLITPTVRGSVWSDGPLMVIAISGSSLILPRISPALTIGTAHFGNTSIYDFLVGPQLYPFGHQHKITVFGQVLFGGGALLYHLPSQNGFNSVTTSYAGLVVDGRRRIGLARKEALGHPDYPG